jgi:hypothetical protein
MEMRNLILLTVLLFTSALGYELTATETREWCQFYAEMSGEFHQIAIDAQSQAEYAYVVEDYIDQLDDAAIGSGWTDNNRTTWIPVFIEIAAAIWEYRDDLTTAEVARAFRTQCIEDQSDHAGTAYEDII